MRFNPAWVMIPNPKGSPRAIVGVPEFQFKKGNYRGYPSREAFTANWKTKMADMKHRVAVRKRHAKVIKEAREVQDDARRLAPLAMKAYEKILKSKTAADQAVLMAASAILDRGYGKALQTNVNANVNDGKPAEITSADLDKRIAEALNRVEELTKREGEAKPSEERPSDLRQYN